MDFQSYPLFLWITMWANCGQPRQVLDFHDLKLECPFSKQAMEPNQINYLARISGNLKDLYQNAPASKANHVWWG
jgi:hypothetical protein